MTPAERELQTAVRRLERLLQDQQREIRALKTARRAPQLGHSSIESGALEVRDPESGQRMRIGIIDGRVGTTTEGGNPVSAPSAPSVTPSLGGLRVTWDGLLAGDVAIPVDFDHMAVHVSTTPGFIPSAATYQGGIRRAGEGGMLPVVPLPYVEHYVVLVPVTTGGVQGAPSAEVAATPLQTSGVDLQADSVDAVHIKAGAVEADKLEAILVLASTIIGGIPGGARVEIDQDGLRGYDESNELIFAVDATGNAVFSGDITGSHISGSSMELTLPTGTLRVHQDENDWPVLQVTDSSGQEAVTVAPGGIYIDSALGSGSDPHMYLEAYEIGVQTQWNSPDGGAIRIFAEDHVAMWLYPPFGGRSGVLFANRRGDDDPTQPAMVGIGSPSHSPTMGDHQWAQIELEGSTEAQSGSRALYYADQHFFALGGTPVATTGVVALDTALSFQAPRHQPAQSSFLAQPNFATSGSFVDFTAAQWAPISFRTSWSGWTRITVQTAGINHASDFASFATSFRLSGGSTVPAALSRCAYIRSRGAGKSEPVQATVVHHLQLVGATDYTLTPAWRISSGSSSTAAYYPTLDNTITVEPLM